MTEGLFWTGLLFMTAVPAVWLRRRHGVCWIWFALGIASWVGGVAAKFALYALEEHLGSTRLPILLQAGLTGLTSGVTELGAAYLILRRLNPTLPELLAFGVGIGIVEVPATLAEGALTALFVGAADTTPALGGGLYILERALSMAGHVASRVLVLTACRDRSVWPGFVALAAFVLVDGAAAHGVGAPWDWDSPRVLGCFLAYVAAVGVAEAGAAWYFWSHPRAPSSVSANPQPHVTQ